MYFQLLSTSMRPLTVEDEFSLSLLFMAVPKNWPQGGETTAQGPIFNLLYVILA
jgi:hypothetical protein